MKKAFALWIPLVVALLATACGKSSSGDAPDAGGTGSLAVTITAPAGVTPSVSVTGPGGYTKSLSATATVSSLSAGSYSVAASPVAVADTIVNTVFDAAVTGSPAAVTAGATANAAVTYSNRAGSGHLWLCDAGLSPIAGKLVSYLQSALATPGSPVAEVAFGYSPASNAPYGPAFDRSGNLWVAVPGASKIVRYAPSLLTTSGSPTETASIADGNGPASLAFDSAGNLWVSDTVNKTIVEYKAADLTGAGILAISPVVTLSVVGATYVDQIAFDSSGNLWLIDSTISGAPFSGLVRKYTAAQIATVGNVSLSATATLNPGLGRIQGLAFDKVGNLWLAMFGITGSDPTVARLDSSQLTGATGSSSITAAYVISSTDFSSPKGVAFDESGNLWISNPNLSSNKLLRFAASQLVGTGNTTLTASQIFTPGGLTRASMMAFDPPATGVPLYR